MHNSSPMSRCGSMTKAALLVIFGVLFLLGTTGVWAEFTFAKYWPVPLIVWGLHGFFCPCGKMKAKGGDCCGEGECKCA